MVILDVEMDTCGERRLKLPIVERWARVLQICRAKLERDLLVRLLWPLTAVS